MQQLILTALVCLAVGLLLGWSSVAGFLLPIFFTGYLGLPLPEALALSFFNFALSGAVGSWFYYKKGNLNIRISLILGAGSLVGALAGVALNLLIPGSVTTLLLYIVVLLSGVSILLRKEKAAVPGEAPRTALDNVVLVAALGVVTGAICSLSGAGGPILVMPLLVVLGMDIRMAVGVALFDSVFIAIPAFVGYATQADLTALLPTILICAVFHGAGVLIGCLTAHHIKQRPLKIAVAVFSIGIAVYRLVAMAL